MRLRRCLKRAPACTSKISLAERRLSLQAVTKLLESSLLLMLKNSKTSLFRWNLRYSGSSQMRCMLTFWRLRTGITRKTRRSSYRCNFSVLGNSRWKLTRNMMRQKWQLMNMKILQIARSQRATLSRRHSLIRTSLSRKICITMWRWSRSMWRQLTTALMCSMWCSFCLIRSNRFTSCGQDGAGLAISDSSRELHSRH